MSTQKDSGAGPVLIELGDAHATGPSPSEVGPVPDEGPAATGAAMQSAAHLAARRPSRMARLFWAALTALLGAVVSIAAWDFATSLLLARPVLGWIVSGLIVVVLTLLLLLSLREVAAFGRLRKIEGFQRRAETALSEGSLEASRTLARDLNRFYAGREETRWGRDKLERGVNDAFDADAVMSRVEQHLLSPLDALAQAEVEAAARQVATITALVPLALADVVATLAANLRMIRRIAEIYGGRAGTLGAWRLTRAVMAHLVATGAVAVGDDLLEPVLGGSILGKVSRRFGEGLVNGALTARVGVAAMEVCRPVPFGKTARPSVRGLVQRALTGLVWRDNEKDS